MKKLLTLSIAFLLCLGIAGCSSNTEDQQSDGSSEPKTEEQTEKNETKVDKINLDNSEGTLTYVKHEVTTDYDGNDAIRVYYSYTNKKEDASSAQMTFYPQAFQNGVECDMAFVADENEASNNAAKDIQKGTTIEIAFEYVLTDVENPVTIKVTDQSAENLVDNIYQEQELSLK